MVRLAVRVERERAELVLAELLELAPSGVEERAVGEDVVEYAVYGEPGELPTLPELTAAAGAGVVGVRTEEIADDWPDRWRQFHKPLVLDRKLTVRPPWEPAGETPIDIVIDPGRAFGTGSHATTRLCLELMVELDSGGPFLDLGCGSGVLAIAATRLGFSPVYAVDIDPASVETTTENARANQAEIEVNKLDLRSELPPPAPTVAANLLAPLLLTWAARLAGAATVPERVIASGVLAAETQSVERAFVKLGFRLAELARDGEWAALLLERSA